jgi:ribosomal protein L37E
MTRLSDKSFRCKNLLGEVVTVKPHWRVIKGSSHRRISFRNRFVVDSESIRCPIRWYCKRLGRVIEVSEDAVYNIEFGFLCDCSTGIICNRCGSSDYSGYGVHLVCNNCGSGKNGSRNDFSGSCVWVKGADEFHIRVAFGHRHFYSSDLFLIDGDLE